ncbi:MAG TPA: sulfurtransferase [Bryobacteraceae bacterium]|nr:sulfurtransferase [Bryobacteraceae bacterium]
MEKYRIAGFLLLAALAGTCAAQTKNMLVSTEWLSTRLQDPSLVILHVGSQQDYDQGHIPGARLLTLAGISVTGERGVRLELPPVKALEAAFGKLGVSNTSRIIIYPGAEAVPPATRVWFTLDYLGAGDRASLLDGGLAAWRAEGRPVTTAAPRVEPMPFTARPRPHAVVNAQWIQARLERPGVVLVDARMPEFYCGSSAAGMPRAGHIPGAHNVPYTKLLDGQKFKPAAALKQLLPPAATGRMVVYCHVGQTATVPYFAARYLGYDVALYDGSFQDWSQNTELPVSGKP